LLLSEKTKIKLLVIEAQKGNQDAMAQLIHRFMPAINKYSRSMGYEEAYADLIAWLIGSINKYKPLRTGCKN